jgi:hypothetical protein
MVIESLGPGGMEYWRVVKKRNQFDCHYSNAPETGEVGSYDFPNIKKYGPCVKVTRMFLFGVRLCTQ